MVLPTQHPLSSDQQVSHYGTLKAAAFLFNFGLITDKGVWESASNVRRFIKTVLVKVEKVLHMNAADLKRPGT